MDKNAALEKARMQMRNAQVTTPEEIPEEMPQRVPTYPQGNVEPQPDQPQPMAMPANNSGEITIMDFMQATRNVQFVDVPWPSKGKSVKVKKFCKGELDRISAPFFKKTLKLDLTQFGGQANKNVPMNFDLSMELFSEMEKIMVELGMCYYKSANGEPIISRNYIDNFMSSEDFQELSGIIQQVNPNALMTSVKQQERVQETKNS